MKILLLTFVMITSLAISPTYAEEPWTEAGIYVFGSVIEGDSQFRNVTVDIDVSFSDILESLELGGMGFIEHRRGKWSFIGNATYMKLSDGGTIASTPVASVTTNVTLEQGALEGYVGYRFFERDFEAASLGVDVITGVRYNFLTVDIGVNASALGLATSASRHRNEDWVDGVLGVRAQYSFGNGWGATGMLDIGKGSDSNSHQIAGYLNYSFKNNIKIFGGYRLLHLEYETGEGTANHFALDADYHGPMFGVSYRF